VWGVYRWISEPFRVAPRHVYAQVAQAGVRNLSLVLEGGKVRLAYHRVIPDFFPPRDVDDATERLRRELAEESKHEVPRMGLGVGPGQLLFVAAAPGDEVLCLTVPSNESPARVRDEVCQGLLARSYPLVLSRMEERVGWLRLTLRAPDAPRELGHISMHREMSDDFLLLRRLSRVEGVFHWSFESRTRLAPKGTSRYERAPVV
jgi:hypothetical protein